MALVHQNNTGLYAGVSRQAIDLRLPSHSEEMINCYPTIQYGVRRRNPTRLISNDILLSDNQFAYSYDRGLAGESSEQYVVTIDDVNGLRVFDIQSAEYKTVTYSGNALKYLESSNPEIGFSAITIKDTTIIANRDITPLRIGDATSGTINKKTITFTSGYSTNYSTVNSYNADTAVPSSSIKKSLAPCRIKTYEGVYSIGSIIGYAKSYTIYSDVSVGATITFVIDGVDYKYTVATKQVRYNIYPETIAEMRTGIYKSLSSQLDDNLYGIELSGGTDIAIIKLDGTAITVTSSISYPSSVDIVPPALSSLASVSYERQTNISILSRLPSKYAYAKVTWSYKVEYNIGSGVVSAITAGTTSGYTQAASDYDKKAFVWIKQVSVDTAFPYKFYVTLKETNGTTIASTSSIETSTTGVASDIASWATGLADFTGTVSGSVARITRDSNTAFEIVVSDTYGSQASSAWIGEVTSMDDLPKSFPFKDTVIKIGGVKRADDVAYWVKYDGNSWVEWRDPNMKYRINGDTMPHKLVRNADFTFTLSNIDWNDILVGDEDSQSLPEIFGNEVQDLFFVNGRLGLLSRNGITLSQQGDLFNLFRTTVLSLLDDSAITTYIDSGKSVGLQYAVELQGSIILFGDKLQFSLDSSKAISPKTISVQPISGFEINKNVKPISSGDSVFFLVSKNGYSSLMEMNQTTVSMNIRAVDVSSHVTDYIDSDIMQLASSTRDNVVFLRSRTRKDTIWIYKHYGTEQAKEQMSWSKWVFSSDISSIFVFDKNLYIFGSRYDSSVPVDEYSLESVWRDERYWLDETCWVDSGMLKTPSFEIMDIDAYGNDASFKDVGSVRYDSEVELSELRLSKSAGEKEIRGSILLKTAEISSEDGSSFYLSVEDVERGTIRSIPEEYTIGRKPFIGGNAKNMKIKIVSNNGNGFQINSISLEGQYNVRSKRV
jgi:hypothetical protein